MTHGFTVPRITFSSLATALAACLCLLVGTALAQEKPNAKAAQEAEAEQAFQAAMVAATRGPADVKLIDQGILKLPMGYLFVPKSEGARLMLAMGNRTGGAFIGLILPDGEARWFATLDHIKAGYVRDDDAKTWNADDLLKTLKEGTEAGNDDRSSRGFPPIEVTGWVEPPVYSAETHRLVWAANVRRKGLTEGGSVNYNTYALGREGYFELNMIGAKEVVEAEKPRAKELLAALAYVPGKAYADFQPGTDKVAEYGLAALVAGVAAKKLGLFALAAAFVLKAWKIVLLAVVGVGTLISKLFGRKSPPAT